MDGFFFYMMWGVLGHIFLFATGLDITKNLKTFILWFLAINCLMIAGRYVQ